jgi:hypothetical protein
LRNRVTTPERSVRPILARMRFLAPLIIFGVLGNPRIWASGQNPISSLTLSPTSVLGGSPSTGTVTLRTAAPAGGAVVSLSSSATAVATLPPSVTVPAGSTTQTFTVTSYPVGASSSATITASYSGWTKTATLTVTAPVLSSLALSPTSVPSGSTSTGTVTLTGPAPAAGTVVTLASSNTSAATPPPNVTVLSGLTSATFTVTTGFVSTSTAVTITATLSGVNKTVTLTVTPVPPALSSISLSPASVLSSATSTGTLTLTQPAPTGGATVSLSSSDPSAAAVPPTATIAAGSASGTFTATTSSVASDTGVTITGTYGATKTATLTVVANLVVSLDAGTGPFYLNTTTGAIAGHVAPATAGPGTTVTGQVATQSVTATPAADGSFSLPLATLLAPGSNQIVVSAVYNATGKTSNSVTATYVYDTTHPTATVNFTNTIPDPTNQPTWTVSGSVSGYQGPVENATVVMFWWNYPANVLARFPLAQDGTWSGQVTFQEGNTLFGLAVQDLAGNLGPKAPESYWYVVGLDTQGLKPLFSNYGTGVTPKLWPASLDDVPSQILEFFTENQVTIAGSHLDLYIDETGNGTGNGQYSCSEDNLACLVQAKTTPDLSVDFTADFQYVTLPALPLGIHNLRMVLRDPFGVTYQRGSVVAACWRGNDGWGNIISFMPGANFGIPGTVTTRLPKLAGRSSLTTSPIDCADGVGNKAPSFTYWDPSTHNGGWKALPVTSYTNPDGIFQAVPNAAQLPSGGIPITTNDSGQQVLRIALTQGSSATAGRKICGRIPGDEMLQQIRYDGSGSTLVYDLSYRAPQTGDDAFPQLDLSATTTTVVTDTAAPYTAKIRVRVTDLNADLNYHSITVTPQDCAGGPCVLPGHFDGDQKLSTTAPGGWFSVSTSLAIGPNTFTVSATDDAGHTTNSPLTITRTLTSVIAMITQPAAASGSTPNSTGTLGGITFQNPRMFTFDASTSINQTSPYAALRFQWTSPTGVTGGVTSWQVVSSSAIYSEYLVGAPAGFNRRRVIVSSSAITAPDPTSDAPCGNAPAGLCSTAEVDFNRTCWDTSSPLPVQILSPGAGASIPMNLPVTLQGTAGNDAYPTYEYHWDLTNTDTGQSYQVPAGANAYSHSYRVVSVTLNTIPNLTAGHYQVSFEAGNDVFGDGCLKQQTRTTISITVAPRAYLASGIAPGIVLPGDTTPALFGQGFDAQAAIAFVGPVYSLTDFNNPLCNLSQGQCPSTILSAIVNASGTALTFAVPADASGVYYVHAQAVDGTQSPGEWLEVTAPQMELPELTPAQHNIATSILSGQTWTGTFAAGGDPSGAFSDYNSYYFVGTAGSTITASLTRNDASLPWEDPNSLDPQIDIIAPDGLVYQNLLSVDNDPGINLNASIANAVLPLTGIYVLRAETMKGGGGYTLQFSIGSVGPISGAARIVPFAGNFNTVTAGTTIQPTALMLDPRGYPVSGASTNFAMVASPDNLGTGQFLPSPTVTTTVEGFAQVNLQMTGAGKIEFSPSFADTTLAQIQVQGAAQRLIPHFDPVGVAPFVVDDIAFGQGQIILHDSPIRRIPSRVSHAATGGYRAGQTSAGSPASVPRPRRGASWESGAGTSIGKASPSPSAGAASIPRLEIVPEQITECQAALFAAACVSNQVRPPFSVVLTDNSPSTGQTVANGVVDTGAGIHGHRVQHRIHMQLEITDATGAAPNSPVLVHLQLGNSNAGSLILDPDGTALECQQQASFLWHEMDANGNIIAENDLFDYRLGTKANFGGVVPDPANPGQVKPVWGLVENLRVQLSTLDPQNNATVRLQQDFPVHPEPGKPDHFEWNPNIAGPQNQKPFLSAYNYQEASPPQELYDNNNYYFQNLYYLDDGFGNRTYGYTNVSASDAAGNVHGSLQAQTPPTAELYDANAYTVGYTWEKNPDWPSGNFTTTLTAHIPVDLPDNDWAAFDVNQNFTGVFSTPQFFTIRENGGYDLPPDFAIQPTPSGQYVDVRIVSPQEPVTDVWPGWGITPGFYGQLMRFPLLLLQGSQVKFFNDVVIEGQQGDPMIVTAGGDTFDISLVDAKGQIAKDAQLQANLCPRYDHTDATKLQNQVPNTCTGPIVTSTNGTLSNIAADQHGYFGVMVSQAPLNPGDYYLFVAPSAGNAHPYYVSGATTPGSAIINDSVVNVIEGEFLDVNLHRVDPFIIRQTMPAYLRVAFKGSTDPSLTLNVHAYDQDSNELGTPVTVTVNRVGSTDIYLGPLQLYPDGDTPPAPGPSTGPSRSVADGPGVITAELAGQTKARRRTVVPYKFQIDWVDNQGNPYPEQYTVIEDRQHNYAEKTYLQVSVRNTHKNNIVVPNFIGCGYLQELAAPTQSPNLVFTGPANSGGLSAVDDNLDQGGDQLFSPDASVPEGQPGFPFQISQGLSQGRDGEAAFFLRAVARRRTDPADPSRPLRDFRATVLAGEQCSSTAAVIDKSDSKDIAMWVDEVEYFPANQSAARHAMLAGDDRTIDWVEKEALDILQSPDPAEADAFGSVEYVQTNSDVVKGDPTVGGFTGPPDGVACPFLAWPTDLTIYHTINLNPVFPGLRWGISNEGAPPGGAYPGAGLYHAAAQDRTGLLGNFVSHEARHSLQNAVSIDTTANDADGDHMIDSLTANGVTLLGGERLLDSPYAGLGGLNPETTGHPGDWSLDCTTWSSFKERDAVAAERRVQMLFALGGIGVWSGAVTMPKDTPTLIGLPTAIRPGFNPAIPYTFWGNLASVAVQSGSCQVGDGVSPFGSMAFIPVSPRGFNLVVVDHQAPDACVLNAIPLIPQDDSITPLSNGGALTINITVSN